MRATTAAFHSNPVKRSTTATHPPSVPLYVYRELATELQATQAQLDALTAKNQQLAQENQYLRQEITEVVQAFAHLQKLVDSPRVDQVGSSQLPRNNQEVKKPTPPPSKEARPRPQSRPRPPEAPKASTRRPDFSVPVLEIGSNVPETIFIEEQPVRYYPSMATRTKEFSGWWLIITIVLTMLTAFGAGYLIVRPLFEHQSR
jgi:hypothetical protein